MTLGRVALLLFPFLGGCSFRIVPNNSCLIGLGFLCVGRGAKEIKPLLFHTLIRCPSLF